MNKILAASSSPLFRHADSTRGIMADVIIALCPAAIYGFFLFGIKAVLVVATTIISCVLSELLWNLALKKKQTVGDLSAIVTGLLLGMNLPSTTPLWIAAIGGAAAIIVVKQMFGGIGYNFVNPAIAARIILLVSFPSYMTAFREPISDAVTSATPLLDSANYTVKELFLGMHAGSLGETSAFLLLLGGLYLIVRKVISPIIPLSFIASVALLSFVSGDNVLKAILSGGLMLGAIFMATDYTTSPITKIGKLIFGIGCGIITFVIRRFASLPEGVSYAIILMNILVPHINSLTLSKPFGAKEAEKRG